MAIVLDRELERAVEDRLSPARPAPTAPPKTQRRAAPIVRFSPLLADTAPAARRSRRSLVWLSVAAHVVLFAVIALMPRRAQTIDAPSLPIAIVFTAPLPDIPETPPMPVLKAPAPKPKPRPEPRVEPPPPVAEAPKPDPKPVVPEVEPAPVARVEPPRPRPAVRTGLLDAEPSGPAIVTSRSSRSTLVAVSGFDTSAGPASSPGRPGRVVDVAFESAPASRGSSRRSGGVVKESGFGEEAVAAAPPKREPQRPVSALDTEVEILSRPKPVYTEEARGLRLEGDVVLDVVFEAKGALRVLGVASGLGHGLDEAAIDAAKKIQFNPARRDGAPVDHQARLRVVFRLA
jgi:TonB family protein